MWSKKKGLGHSISSGDAISLRSRPTEGRGGIIIADLLERKHDYHEL
ncbi:hypothetical protein HYS47_03760 [Candidatus Woesearchaeota archaeon]|nr:hypothetical protein [Candidatus Woesearchaeota archaeon]